MAPEGPKIKVERRQEQNNPCCEQSEVTGNIGAREMGGKDGQGRCRRYVASRLIKLHRRPLPRKLDAERRRDEEQESESRKGSCAAQLDDCFGHGENINGKRSEIEIYECCGHRSAAVRGLFECCDAAQE
ncbi:hypothetical protein B0H19DRAFT_1058696 [Mycena capillaripes]|nr:hypothetical protein B0H19DRAFT_1058696 [Mycena capillaripes]